MPEITPAPSVQDVDFERLKYLFEQEPTDQAAVSLDVGRKNRDQPAFGIARFGQDAPSNRAGQISILLGQILAPGSKLLSQLNGPGGKLLSQVKKKSEGEEAPAADAPAA